MKTIVYLIRHSEKFKIKNQKTNDSFQMQNEKMILTVLGEEKARKMSEMPELSNIDIVVSSHYSRAVATAKYIAYKNNIELFVNSNFGERKSGVDAYDKVPKDFELNQFKNENYKLETGESRKETYERMISDLIDILNNNKGKKIAIVFHATAMMYLLQRWCELSFDGYIYSVYFKDKKIFDLPFRSPEIFKLEFDENHELLNIENIEVR